MRKAASGPFEKSSLNGLTSEFEGIPDLKADVTFR
jgi:hypothetical protein